MRKIFTFIITLGLISTAFSQTGEIPAPGHSATDLEDDWEKEIVPDSKPESEPEQPPNQAKEDMQTGPIDFGELVEEEVSIKQEATQEKETLPLFMGISLALDMYSENFIDGAKAKHGGIFADHYGFDIGFLVGFDIYRWLSFQTGLNFIFHHAKYEFPDRWDNSTLELYRYMLEIPAQFRFAIPSNNDIVRPFASISPHIRKPIYAYIYKESINNGLDKSEFYSIIDWDFMEYLGFGAEFYRHFTIQYQLLLLSIRTHSDKVLGVYDAGFNTWRLNLEYSW